MANKAYVVSKAFPDATVTQARLERVVHRARMVHPERTALRVQVVRLVHSDPLGHLAHPVRVAYLAQSANRVCVVNKAYVVSRECQGVLGRVVHLVRVAHPEHLVHQVRPENPVRLASQGPKVQLVDQHSVSGRRRAPVQSI
jgi:hypothetical protein